MYYQINSTTEIQPAERKWAAILLVLVTLITNPLSIVITSDQYRRRSHQRLHRLGFLVRVTVPWRILRILSLQVLLESSHVFSCLLLARSSHFCVRFP